MPRTPADIGRDIAAAQQTINALKAELADVPPQALEIVAAERNNPSEPRRKVTFEAYSNGRPLIFAERTQRDGEVVYAGTQIEVSDVPRLVAWLNHYYPEDAS